jgi:hypothetical protein
VEEAHVHDDQSDVGSDTEGEASKMQSRVDRTPVTDAGHQKGEIGQDGENEPSNDENLAQQTAGTPTGGTQRYVSQHRRPHADGGCGRRRVAGRKAHIGVQQNQQESSRVFGHDNHGDQRAIARICQTEELRDQEQQGGDKYVRQRGDP